jgi:uncharacterized protein YjiS (DUF1127 family)
MGPQQLPACIGGPAAILRLCGGIAAALALRSLRAGDTLLRWQGRYRRRRALTTLSDHMLKDLGLSRVDAEHEGGRRF